MKNVIREQKRQEFGNGMYWLVHKKTQKSKTQKEKSLKIACICWDTKNLCDFLPVPANGRLQSD